MGTAESPEQQEEESEPNVQEKCGGQHDSARPQPEDNAGSGSLGGYATFENTWSTVEHEISEGTYFVAEAYEAMDELAATEQRQARLAKVTTWPSWISKSPCQRLATLRAVVWKMRLREPLNCSEKRTTRTRSHRERCQRATTI